jgi:hypothetical protein
LLESLRRLAGILHRDVPNPRLERDLDVPLDGIIQYGVEYIVVGFVLRTRSAVPRTAALPPVQRVAFGLFTTQGAEAPTPPTRDVVAARQ